MLFDGTLSPVDGALIGPVWQTSHVWLIFDLVVLWTAFPAAFPAAFAAITSTLFDPLILAVFAIVLRGAGFAFHKSLRRLPLQALTGGIFAFSSVAAPFFMGTVIGAIASGQVPAGGGADRTAAWTGKLGEQDERDVTQADVPGLQAADAAAYVGRRRAARTRAGQPAEPDRRAAARPRTFS